MTNLITYSDLNFFLEADTLLSKGDLLMNFEIMKSLNNLEGLLSNTNFSLKKIQDKSAYLDSKIFKFLYKTGTKDIVYHSEDIDTMAKHVINYTNNFRPIFLLSKESESMEKPLMNNGYISILSSKIFELYSYRFANSIDKEGGKHLNKSNLLPLNITCNALIIIDKYLFNNTQSYPNSIKLILEQMLPSKSCTTTIHLTFITGNDNGYNLNNEIDKIRSIIYNIRGDNFPYILNIFIITHLGHENRHIITNYHLIHSAHGFDFNITKKTLITIHYFANIEHNGIGIAQAYDRLISECNEIISPIIQSNQSARNGKRVAYGDWKEGNRLIMN